MDFKLPPINIYALMTGIALLISDSLANESPEIDRTATASHTLNLPEVDDKQELEDEEYFSEAQDVDLITIELKKLQQIAQEVGKYAYVDEEGNLIDEKVIEDARQELIASISKQLDIGAEADSILKSRMIHVITALEGQGSALSTTLDEYDLEETRTHRAFMDSLIEQRWGLKELLNGQEELTSILSKFNAGYQTLQDATRVIEGLWAKYPSSLQPNEGHTLAPKFFTVHPKYYEDFLAFHTRSLKGEGPFWISWGGTTSYLTPHSFLQLEDFRKSGETFRICQTPSKEHCTIDQTHTEVTEIFITNMKLEGEKDDPEAIIYGLYLQNWFDVPKERPQEFAALGEEGLRRPSITVTSEKNQIYKYKTTYGTLYFRVEGKVAMEHATLYQDQEYSSEDSELSFEDPDQKDDL